MRRPSHRSLPAVVAALAASTSMTLAESASGGAVAEPRFVRNIATGETGWFSSPGLVDLDEIVLSTFDHGIDVYRVSRSGTNRLPWPTGRGNLLRNGS
jgi:hypothetical protein